MRRNVTGEHWNKILSRELSPWSLLLVGHKHFEKSSSFKCASIERCVKLRVRQSRGRELQQRTKCVFSIFFGIKGNEIRELGDRYFPNKNYLFLLFSGLTIWRQIGYHGIDGTGYNSSLCAEVYLADLRYIYSAKEWSSEKRLLCF